MAEYDITVRCCRIYPMPGSDTVHRVKSDDLEATMQWYEIRGLVVLHIADVKS